MLLLNGCTLEPKRRHNHHTTFIPQEKNKMTITESRMNEMFDAGYPIEISHYRILKDTGKLVLTYNNSRSKGKYGKKPEYSPYGGKTIVMLDDQAFIAYCSDKDHFCFKDGTFLAVSRAYTYFKEHCEEMEQGVAIQQEVPKSKSCCGGGCCKDMQESDEGTFQTVYKEATKFSIICQDPKTQEFIGYVSKNDEVIDNGSRFTNDLLTCYTPDDYTKEVTEAAEFDTKEEAEQYLASTAERVIKANYKLIGQVTVTDA